ncbi:MAG: tyrosine-type recombinase/integrase [Betaproteobacteria bacterium]|nr:tyrosine-type recombinase/integrase [Betaproteobacteria bacterium]
MQRLLAAALQLPTDRSSSALRPWTFHCLLGLLSVTGLRISEALDLKLGDVDMQQAVLTIHAAKLGRSRLVPLHATTCAVLAEYMRRREDFLGLRDSNYLFISTKGTVDGGRVPGVELWQGA